MAARMPKGGFRTLPIEQLQRLKDHKYASEGRSILDTQFQPFWNWIVSLMPLWVAPNLLTGAGLVLNVVSSLCVVYYSPSMGAKREEVPAWCFVFCAVGLFLYQTLDNIDGKQARRTKTANPLGELFDHGCDAISTVVVIVAYLAAVRSGTGTLGFTTYLVSIVLYYVVHWDCYVKGRLLFETIDVTEAQWLIISMHLLTAWLGQDFWSETTLFGFYISDLVTVPAALFALFRGAVNMMAILEGGKGPEGTTVAETSVLSPLLPFAALAGALYYLQGTASYQECPVLLLLGGGCATAKLTWRLIVGHMSASPISQFDAVHIVPLLYVGFEILGLDSLTAMTLCSAIWLVDLAAYSYRVVMDLCDFLGVDCFRIDPPKPSSS